MGMIAEEMLEMKVCHNCGELNGDSIATCFKCGNAFPGSMIYRKMCPKCHAIYSRKATVCESCDTQLFVLSDSSNSVRMPKMQANGVEGRGLLYLVALLVPLAGFIIGGVYTAAPEGKKHGFGIKLIQFTFAVYGIGILIGLFLLLR